MTLKKQYNVVFQPYRQLGQPRRRFMISINRLADYIGENRANYIIKNAQKMTTNSRRFKAQSCGIVDVYLK